MKTVTDLQQLTSDLSTAIQCAIDDANLKGQSVDPVLDGVMAKIVALYESRIDG